MSSVVADLEQVARLLVSGRGRNLDGLSEDEFAAGQALMIAVSRHADLLGAAWLAASARRGAHRAAGDLTPEAMLARTQGRSRRDAVREVRMAQFLDESPVLREQMVKPGMSTRKASIIAEAMDRLPRELSAADRSVVEAELVRVAPGMSVEQLSRKARRAVEAVDVELADQIENRQLVRAEAEQAKAAMFWMSRPDGAGMVKGGFTIDAVTADMLRAVVEAQTSPRRRLEAESESGVGVGVAAQRAADCGDLVDERPDGKHRAGAAFTDIIRHLPSGEFGNHGGVAATLMVTVTEDSLRGRTDAAGLPSSAPASRLANFVRWLAAPALCPPFWAKTHKFWIWARQNGSTTRPNGSRSHTVTEAARSLLVIGHRAGAKVTTSFPGLEADQPRSKTASYSAASITDSCTTRIGKSDSEPNENLSSCHRQRSTRAENPDATTTTEP